MRATTHPQDVHTYNGRTTRADLVLVFTRVLVRRCGQVIVWECYRDSADFVSHDMLDTGPRRDPTRGYLIQGEGASPWRIDMRDLRSVGTWREQDLAIDTGWVRVTRGSVKRCGKGCKVNGVTFESRSRDVEFRYGEVR